MVSRARPMSIDTATTPIYAEQMELHLTAEQEAHLHQIAQHEGKTPEDVIVDTVLSGPPDDLQSHEILKARIRRADEGYFIEEDEMDRRFKKMVGL